MRVPFGLWAAVWVGVVGCGTQPAPDGSIASVRAAALPAIAVGPELGTDKPVLIQKDVGWNPSASSDGSGFLAVETIAGLVRGVRVSASGQVLDATWLSFGGGPDQLYPDVAFGAEHYLVTWTELGASDPDHPDEPAPSAVHGRFVKPDGTVQGSDSFIVSSGNAMYASAAWNGSNFIVAWLGFGDAKADVHTALIDGAGARVTGSEHTVSTSGKAGDPRLTVSGEQAFVAWYDYSPSSSGDSSSVVYGARIAADGTVKDPGGHPLSTGSNYESSVAVASDGAGFLAVWQTSSDPSEVRGSLIGADGVVSVRDFPIPSTSSPAGLPSAAFDGARYVVAWADDRDEHSLYGVHVSKTGEVASDETRLAEGSPRSVSFGSDRTVLAFSGSKLLTAFVGTGVEGSLLSPSLTIENGALGLTALPNAQGYPQIGWNGANYLVTWVNELTDWNDTSARAVRISGEGAVLDPDGLVLSGDAPVFSASLASNLRNSALVAWANSDDTQSLFLRTVSSLGALGEPQAFPATETSSGLSLASSGGGYLAVVDDTASGKVKAYVLDASGNAGPAIELAASQFNSGSTVHAADGGYVVIYGGPGTHLLPVDQAGVAGTPITLSEQLAYVNVATSGDHSLVVWSTVGEQTVHAQRFEQGALVGDAFVLSERSAGYGATVAWDGDEYFAAWDLSDYTLEGRAVAADGTLGEVLPLANAEASGPTLSSDGNGQMLLSYVRWFEHAQTRRVAARLLGRGADLPGAGGAGGAGEVGGSANVAGAPNTSTGGASATGGATSNGGATSTGGAANGGAANGGKASGGSAGSGDGAGSPGSGATGGISTIPPGCSLMPLAPGSSAPLWLGAALLGVLRRRRLKVAG